MTRFIRLVTALSCSLIVPTLFAQSSVLPPAQGPPVVVPQTPSATPISPPVLMPALQLPMPMPPVTTVPDVTKYLNNPDLLKFSTAQLASFNGRDADMIFLGDSITQGWRTKGEAVWQANFAPRKALDFGISGDQTQHVLWRMENYPIQRLHPKVAVVLIGTNNLRNTAPEIADGVKAVLTKTQTMFPGIKIILCSIMPTARSHDLMVDANKLLRTFADEKTVYYLDFDPIMTPVGDNWKGLGADKLHPDADGYQLWADALLPIVNKLIPAPVVGMPNQF
jgi:lysophospholipase L1-like esterase